MKPTPCFSSEQQDSWRTLQNKLSITVGDFGMLFSSNMETIYMDMDERFIL